MISSNEFMFKEMLDVPDLADAKNINTCHQTSRCNVIQPLTDEAKGNNMFAPPPSVRPSVYLLYIMDNTLYYTDQSRVVHILL